MKEVKQPKSSEILEMANTINDFLERTRNYGYACTHLKIFLLNALIDCSEETRKSIIYQIETLET
jgi:hypothetical protein